MDFQLCMLRTALNKMNLDFSKLHKVSPPLLVTISFAKKSRLPSNPNLLLKITRKQRLTLDRVAST